MGLVMREVTPGSDSWRGSMGKGQSRGVACPPHQPQLLPTSCWVPGFSAWPFCGQERPEPVACPLGAQEMGLA